MRRHQRSSASYISTFSVWKKFSFQFSVIKASVSTETKEACASGNFLAVSFRRSTTANPQALALQAKEHVSHYQQKQNRETICQNKQAFCSSKQLWQCNHDKWRRKKRRELLIEINALQRAKEVQHCFLRELNYSALRCVALDTK